MSKRFGGSRGVPPTENSIGDSFSVKMLYFGVFSCAVDCGTKFTF